MYLAGFDLWHGGADPLEPGVLTTSRQPARSGVPCDRDHVVLTWITRTVSASTGPAGSASELDDQREWTVVHALDLHHRSEHSGGDLGAPPPEFGHHLVDQRLGEVTGCCPVPGRPPALQGAAVQ